MSRALFYAIKGGEREPSEKMLSRLRETERETGMTVDAPESAESPSKPLGEMTLLELLDLFEGAGRARRKVGAGVALAGVEMGILNYINRAAGLGDAVLRDRSGVPAAEAADVAAILAEYPAWLIDASGEVKDLVQRLTALVRGEGSAGADDSPERQG